MFMISPVHTGNLVAEFGDCRQNRRLSPNSATRIRRL